LRTWSFRSRLWQTRKGILRTGSLLLRGTTLATIDLSET